MQPPLDHRDGQKIGERRRLSGGSPISCQYSSRRWKQQEQQQEYEGSLTAHTSPAPRVMLQQYQQQPDYTPYGGIGYGAQPNAGYFNYGGSESSWYGSPSPGGDHSQNMVSLLVFKSTYLDYRDT